MNFRITGIVLLLSMCVLNMIRSFSDLAIPYGLTIITGILGLIALGIDQHRRNRLKAYTLRLSVFVLALILIAALQYFVAG